MIVWISSRKFEHQWLQQQQWLHAKRCGGMCPAIIPLKDAYACIVSS